MENAQAVSLGAQKDSLGERHLIFSLSREQLAMPLSAVREVIGNAKTTPLPKAPPGIKGILNLRGKIVSVVDLRVKMGKGTPVDSPETAIIILDHPGDGALGVIVDSVDRVVHFDGSQVSAAETMPQGFASKMIEGIVRLENDLILILNVESVLS